MGIGLIYLIYTPWSNHLRYLNPINKLNPSVRNMESENKKPTLGGGSKVISAENTRLFVLSFVRLSTSELGFLHFPQTFGLYQNIAGWLSQPHFKFAATLYLLPLLKLRTWLGVRPPIKFSVKWHTIFRICAAKDNPRLSGQLPPQTR